MLDAMTTFPTSARVADISRVINALVAAGVWGKLTGLYVMAAHDSQAARLDWMHPTTAAYTLTVGGTPTFTTDRGYTGDGSAAYLDNAVAMNALPGYTLDSAHIGAWILTNVAENLGDLGSTTASQIRLRTRSSTDTLTGRINSTNQTTVTGITTSIGHSVLNRSGASAVETYKNGVNVGSSTEASTAVPTGVFSPLRENATFSTKRIAIAHSGVSMTAAQHSAFYTIFLTYLQSVGAA